MPSKTSIYRIANFFLILFFTTISTLADCQNVAQSISKLSPKEQVNYILENSHKTRSVNTDTAIFYINYAIDLAKQHKLSDKAALAYMEKGILHYYLGEFDKELAAYQQGLKIAERIKNKSVQGNILKEIAAHYNRQKELWKAIEYFQKSAEFCQAANDMECVASAIRGSGRTYLKLNNLDSAEICLVQSYEIKKNRNDSIGLPYALNDLSEIAFRKKDFKNAVYYLEQSSAIREVLKDSLGLAVNLNNIGELYFEQKNYPKAIDFFEQSLVLTRQLKYTDLQFHTLNAISASLSELSDNPSIYNYFQESLLLKDSLYSTEKAKAISEMQTKYETEKKEQIIENQQSELKIQRLIGFSVLSVLLLIGFVIYYRIYQRRKYERQIQALQIKQKLQKERERISRDLHDNVGANLTKIITDLDLLSLQLEMKQTEKSSQRIENTRNFTQSTIRVLRDTIWAMNKDAYNVLEFSDKAEAFLQHYLEDNMDWEVIRNLQTERQLTSMQVLNLLRIIQEATQNMLKYSQATDFKIMINNNEKFNLKITDNGIGFNKNTVSTDDNYGLYNMQKRAEDIGGSLNIEAKENEGVVIDLYL